MVSDKKKDIVNKPVFDLPKGRYRLIGWDIDTTGKRIGDEICQVAGYYPDSKFVQYIMPQKNLSWIVERQYKIRVITVSSYRMLKDLRTNKLLKTKSEISALTDFISWLEKNKGNSNDGIILVHHEMKKKIIPSIFLDALKRNKLFDRFTAVVKGFCNIYTVAKIKCPKSLRSFSLKVLSRVLLNNEDNDLTRSAAVRAKAYYNIVQSIKQGQDDLQELDSDPDFTGNTALTSIHLSEFARQYSHSTDIEVKALEDLKDFLERLNSLRPIFKELMNFDWISRINAGRLRSKLAENNHYNQLQDAWNNGGKKSIIQILKTVSTTRKKDYGNLLKILECYFDPQKESVNSNFFQRRKIFTRSIENDDQEEANNLFCSSSEFSDNRGESSLQSKVLPPACYYQIAFIN